MFKNENGEDVYFLSMKIDNDYQVVPMTKEQFDSLNELKPSIANLFDQHTTVANKITATITQVITRISHQSNLKHEYSSVLNSCFKKL